jgi:hypothetical protein
MQERTYSLVVERYSHMKVAVRGGNAHLLLCAYIKHAYTPIRANAAQHTHNHPHRSVSLSFASAVPRRGVPKW